MTTIRARIAACLTTAALVMTGCAQHTTEQALVTPSATPAPQTPVPETPSPSATPVEELVRWEDNTAVSHLFFHSLVVDPDRAFDGDENSAGYLDYMVTVSEFEAVLEHVYERDYILVSPHDLYEVTDEGTLRTKPLELPEGKKPLVLSFDDLSYYEYMEDDGFADRLILHHGEVVNEYTDATGQTHIGDYDYVPILDAFVAEHPDFSLDGAKGVIALTGYNGIFGYRTSEETYGSTNTQLAADQRSATAIAEALKDTGWEFASHSWGHINYTTSSVEFIQQDHQRWVAEVQPLIGATDLLIYPFGADIAGVQDYSGAKFDYLKDQGFNVFFGIDASVPAWGQLRDDYFRQARINVDGISLKNAVEGNWDALEEFFDPAAILDPERPDSISGTT